MLTDMIAAYVYAATKAEYLEDTGNPVMETERE